MARTPGGELTPEGAPGTYDEQRLWLGVRRSTWQLVAYLALAGGVVVGFIQDDRQDDRERREDVAEQAAIRTHDALEEENEDYLACLRGNQQRGALRSAIQASYASGGSASDVTRLPEWAPVVEESPAVAALLLVLLAPRDAEDRDAQRDAVLASVPVDRDCEADYPDHTPGIESRAGLSAPTTTTTVAGG